MAETDETKSALFAGLPTEELAALLRRLERRHFPAGTTVLAEGDGPHEMYIIQAGTAQVSVAEPNGGTRHIALLGPGATIGEMSLFTGQPVSATVRATPDAALAVLVVSAAELQRIAEAFPLIYRNLGMIFAERLVATNRLARRARGGQVVLLEADDAPPLLGYALACSLAWHARAPTLLLVLAQESPAPALAALAAAVTHGTDAALPAEDRAALLVAAPRGAYAPNVLAHTVEDLRARYRYVLVQVPAGAPHLVLDARTLRLVGPHVPVPADAQRRPGQVIRGWSDGARVALRPDLEGVLCVPALTREDEHELARGVLPAASSCGRALSWAARDLASRKVGLALGGGGQRGYAHLGALAALERLGVPVDYIAGTSIGAAVATAYALGYPREQAADLLDLVGGNAVRLTLPRHSLLSNAGLREGVLRFVGDHTFEELELPLALAAVDLPTQREVIFRRGLLWPALLASVSIPVIYPPQRMGNYLLVDGGVLNPVPCTAAAAMGADVVIAIKLFGRSGAPESDVVATESRNGGPALLQAILTTIDTIQQKAALDSAAAATIIIEPRIEDISVTSLRNFKQGRRCIPAGERAIEEALPRLAGALPWLRTYSTVAAT